MNVFVTLEIPDPVSPDQPMPGAPSGPDVPDSPPSEDPSIPPGPDMPDPQPATDPPPDGPEVPATDPKGPEIPRGLIGPPPG
jgi:hypothetical protein